LVNVPKGRSFSHSTEKLERICGMCSDIFVSSITSPSRICPKCAVVRSKDKRNERRIEEKEQEKRLAYISSFESCRYVIVWAHRDSTIRARSYISATQMKADMRLGNYDEEMIALDTENHLLVLLSDERAYSVLTGTLHFHAWKLKQKTKTPHNNITAKKSTNIVILYRNSYNVLKVKIKPMRYIPDDTDVLILMMLKARNSYQEIAKAVMTGTSRVQYRVDRLEANEYVRKPKDKKARSIVVLPKGETLILNKTKKTGE